MRYLFFASCLLAVLMPAAAGAANECPSAVSGRGSFIIERSGSSSTEVFYGDGPVVRTVMKSGGRVLLETTQHEGLIQLDRIDRGRRTVYQPKSDLAKLFPLRPKQKMDVLFDTSEAGQPASMSSIRLTVVGMDTLSIGRCKYDVVKIERAETHRGQKREPIVDYYAPELKFVIGKEYKERGGGVTLIKFDAISQGSSQAGK